jgi:RNA polymerase sigma-70 factor (ECF subfamily)
VHGEAFGEDELSEAQRQAEWIAPPRTEPEIAALVARATAGEAGAFEQLYHWYRPTVYRSILAFLRDHGNERDAEDVEQGVFLAALKALPSYEPSKGQFGAWLFGITKNAAIDWHRANSGTVPMAPWKVQARLETAWDGEMERWLADEAFMRRIAHLPREQQRVLMLRFRGDWSPERIASALSKQANAVVQAQHRGMTTLRARAAPRAAGAGTGRVERHAIVRRLRSSPSITQRRLSLAF